VIDGRIGTTSRWPIDFHRAGCRLAVPLLQLPGKGFETGST